MIIDLPSDLSFVQAVLKQLLVKGDEFGVLFFIIGLDDRADTIPCADGLIDDLLIWVVGILAYQFSIERKLILFQKRIRKIIGNDDGIAFIQFVKRPC